MVQAAGYDSNISKIAQNSMQGCICRGFGRVFFYKINARNDRLYAKLNTVYLNELCILINMFIRLAFRPSTGILLTTDHLSRNNDRELDISNSGLTHSDP